MQQPKISSLPHGLPLECLLKPRIPFQEGRLWAYFFPGLNTKNIFAVIASYLRFLKNYNTFQLSPFCRIFSNLLRAKNHHISALNYQEYTILFQFRWIWTLIKNPKNTSFKTRIIFKRRHGFAKNGRAICKQQL